MGDTNAKCEMWGGTTTDPHGRIFEQLLLNMNISLLNSGAHAHYHSQTNSSSAIDLSLCSPELLPEFSLRVDNDLHGSDHYPIIVEDITREPIVRPMQYIIKKAGLKLFTAQTVMQGDNEQNCDAKLNKLMETILDAADRYIPKTSGRESKIRVLWWMDECVRVMTERRHALRCLQRTGLDVD